jgi:hypothetical protein
VVATGIYTVDFFYTVSMRLYGPQKLLWGDTYGRVREFVLQIFVIFWDVALIEVAR